MSDTDQLLPLNALNTATYGTIVALTGHGPSRQRLMDMGLTPGARVAVEGTAPLGDPIIVWVRGSRLALRHREAAQILVEPCPHRYPGRGPQSAETWNDGSLTRPRHGHRWRHGRRGKGQGGAKEPGGRRWNQ